MIPSTPPPFGSDCVCTEPYYSQILTCLKSNCDTDKLKAGTIAAGVHETTCGVIKDSGSSLVSDILGSLTSSVSTNTGMGTATSTRSTSIVSSSSVLVDGESTSTSISSSSAAASVSTSVGTPSFSTSASASVSPSPSTTSTSGASRAVSKFLISVGMMTWIAFGVMFTFLS